MTHDYDYFMRRPRSYADFGPYTPGFIKIPYNNVDALAEALKDPDHKLLVELIQR